MCGIVGYIGKEKAIPVLMDGLRALEYRGYDSAGIAVLGDAGIFLKKSVGKVAELEDKISDEIEDDGRVGIAHTRWATHGTVTETNAHPHTDCDKSLFVVHNGIIENYKELREKLEKSGHQFASETDTETIVHLIEEVQKAKSVPLEEAVRLALGKIQGTYGLVVIDTKDSDKIVVARNFSPLILGVGENEFIVASDASAILKYTNNVIYINDGEIVTIVPSGYRISTIDNKVVSRKPKELDWDVSTAQKDNFPHFMLKEIYEEPESIQNTLRGRLRLGKGDAVLGGLSEVKDKLGDINRIHICACGTASFAGMVGAYMLEEYTGIPTHVEVGSEFRYKKPVFDKKDVFIAISQSGETADTLASLYEAKKKNVLTLGVVNVVGSTLSRETDAGVYLHAGPEIGVASTKAFLSQLTVMALLTLFIGRRGNMSLVTGKRIAKELSATPGLVEKILDNGDAIKKLANKYKTYENFLYLGRKYNYPVALEGALKIKEISYVHADGLASGEMKHGTIALIDENFPSVVITTKDSVYEKNISNIEEIKARGGPVIAIATDGDKDIEQVADDVVYIPKTLEMLTPLLSVVPLHLFAYYVGVARGYDVDKPRNLAKSVTVE